MEHPPCFQDLTHSHYACLLENTLYDLKQSLRLWHFQRRPCCIVLVLVCQWGLCTSLSFVSIWVTSPLVLLHHRRCRVRFYTLRLGFMNNLVSVCTWNESLGFLQRHTVSCHRNSRVCWNSSDTIGILNQGKVEDVVLLVCQNQTFKVARKNVPNNISTWYVPKHLVLCLYSHMPRMCACVCNSLF